MKITNGMIQRAREVLDKELILCDLGCKYIDYKEKEDYAIHVWRTIEQALDLAINGAING